MRQTSLFDTIPVILAAVILNGFLLAPAAQAQGFDDRKSDMLGRTGVLLEQVEGTILGELKAEEEELEAQAENIVSSATGNAEREARVKAQDAAMRAKADELMAKVETWSQSGELYLEQVSAQELNDLMAEARTVAKYFGLDVEKLGKLYEIGKQTIKDHEFVLPDRLPPDKDENYDTYFTSFFVFAHEREYDLSEYRRKQQEYRLTLFKRVTLAYIRALLASARPVKPCTPSMNGPGYWIGQKKLQGFGCADPVVDNLRGYVQAIQKIASADADRFNAEAEIVVAQQALTSDLAAGLPLVGDAIDYYSLYSGENLAGQCLSRFEYGLTAVFSIIPFIPSSWATQVVKRMGLEDAMSKMVMMFAHSGEWSAEMAGGMAARFGLTAERFAMVAEKMKPFQQIMMTEVGPGKGDLVENVARKFGLSEEGLETAYRKLNSDVTFAGLKSADEVVIVDGVVSDSAAESLGKPLNEDGVFIRNLEMAREGQNILRKMPPEIREKMIEKARKILADNLDAVPANRLALNGDYSEVVALSNMVPEHLTEFLKEAEELDNVVLFRYVNEFSTEKIAQDFATKGMPVKGKSSDWGPQAAFLPVDQNFSKLGNPKGKIDPAEVAAYSEKVAKCLKSGPCEQTNLKLANGDEVFIWKSPNGEVPVIKRDGKFLEHESGRVLDVAPDDARPMSVLAARHPETNELIPLTADYDLLAVGARGDVEMPKFRDDEGFINAVESKVAERMNAAGERAGYKGGKLVHHGPEAQFTGSPGAFGKDPLITLADPEKGLLTIPRCEYDCMKKWCETTNMCGGMPVCSPTSPRPPCMAIDTDRLLKDYFNDARLRGYTTLRPNSAWDWGEYNGISGWTPKILLDNSADDPAKWAFGQYRMKFGVSPDRKVDRGMLDMFSSRNLQTTAMKAVHMLFTCPGAPVPGDAQ